MIDSVLLNFIGSASDSVIEYVEKIEEGRITGSLGQVKTITDYDNAGNIMKRTEFYYTNTTFSSKVSRIIVLSGDE